MKNEFDLDKRFEVKYIQKKNTFSFKDFYFDLRIKKVYETVTVNNIYFDTIDNQFFQNHVEGNLDRIKVRIRWYNNSTFYKDKYILEIKRKINNTLKKYRKLLPVKSFEDLNSIDFYSHLIGIINKNNLSLNYVKYLMPKIYNRYDREYYFINENKSNRITYDKNLFFSTMIGMKLHPHLISTQMNIIEHKYLGKIEKKNDKFMSHNLIKTNFSKYLYAMLELKKELVI